MLNARAQMLVLPLERIFNTIRRNAAEIIMALGDADPDAAEDEKRRREKGETAGAELACRQL